VQRQQLLILYNSVRRAVFKPLHRLTIDNTLYEVSTALFAVCAPIRWKPCS